MPVDLSKVKREQNRPKKELDYGTLNLEFHPMVSTLEGWQIYCVSRYEQNCSGSLKMYPESAKLIERQTNFWVPYGTFDHGWLCSKPRSHCFDWSRGKLPERLVSRSHWSYFWAWWIWLEPAYVFKYPPLQSPKYGKDTIASRTALRFPEKFGRKI